MRDRTAIYEQLVTKQKRTVPRLVWCSGGSVSRRDERNGRDRRFAEAPLQRFAIRENGLNFLISFGEGLSTGIFLDQRENRRRLLMANLAGKTLLNCFAYTCAFSVAAAKAGAVTTSIDLSRHYLEWGKDNFRANDLDPEAHRFLVGDVLEWLKRFQKRGQAWDIVVLDPPTFSTTKKGRAFQAERDYEEVGGAGNARWWQRAARCFARRISERWRQTNLRRHSAKPRGRRVASLRRWSLRRCRSISAWLRVSVRI